MTSHRFKVLYDFSRSIINEADAIRILGVSAKTLHQIHTIWHKDLRTLNKLVDRLQTPKNTKIQQTAIKRDLAEALKISYREVNRLLKRSGISVPRPKSIEKREQLRKTAEKRRKVREKHVLDVIAGLSDVENAAEQAEVTQRHIYRLVRKMTALVGVNYRDLRRATLVQREKVASQVSAMLDLDSP